MQKLHFRQNAGGRTMTKQTQFILAQFGIFVVVFVCGISLAAAKDNVLTTPVQGDTGTVQQIVSAPVYTVPDGQRLNIEFLTVLGNISFSDEQESVTITIYTTLDTTEVIHAIVTKQLADFDLLGNFSESRAVQLFADPNTVVTIRVVDQFGEHIAGWRGTIVGRLEPVQQK